MRADLALLRDEIAWGESQELLILKRWLGLSLYAAGARRVVKSNSADEYDFMILAARGLPLCYVEVKSRRSKLERFDDAIFPWTKHLFARRLAAFNIPLVGVTVYGCGSLVEVNLSKRPTISREITRRDRLGAVPVRHAFYGKRQITVLERGHK